MDNINQYLKLDHGVSSLTPVVLKHDIWKKAGRGQFDMHYEVELGILVSGKIIRKHGLWKHLFSKGDIWLNSVWEPHGTEIVEVPSELIIFHIYPPALAQLHFPEYGHLNWLSIFTSPIESRFTSLTKNPDLPLRIANLAIKLSKEQQRKPSPIYNLKIRHLMMELLIGIAEENPSKINSDNVSCSYYAKINKGIELVFNSREMVTFEEAVKASGINRTHFSRYFKELMGMSFAKFARRYRLGCAADDLRSTSMTIKEISSKWGFSDNSHFYRNFVRNYGTTPGEYRRG